MVRFFCLFLIKIVYYIKRKLNMESLSQDEIIYCFTILAKHDGGYVDELNEIDPKMVDYFVKNGNIIIKTDSDGKDRYRLCGTDMDDDGSLCGPHGEDGTK